MDSRYTVCDSIGETMKARMEADRCIIEAVHAKSLNLVYKVLLEGFLVENISPKDWAKIEELERGLTKLYG